MTHFIAYYRVSTARQGKSGLGLEAQQAAVAAFTKKAKVLANYTDIESGKKHQNRPQLLKAIAHSKETGATLLIAKLDRLSRNFYFITGLMESKVRFQCCDMPEADNLTIHVLAAVAELERDLISDRTKAALAAAKARGKKLGNPKWRKALKAANAARGNCPTEPGTLNLIVKLRSQGASLGAIQTTLNSNQLFTGYGNPWHKTSIQNALRYAAGETSKEIRAARAEQKKDWDRDLTAAMRAKGMSNKAIEWAQTKAACSTAAPDVRSSRTEAVA